MSKKESEAQRKIDELAQEKTKLEAEFVDLKDVFSVGL